MRQVAGCLQLHILYLLLGDYGYALLISSMNVEVRREFL